MTDQTAFAAALHLCGLTQSQAADFFAVSPHTVKSWCSPSRADRYRVPAGVWEALRAYWRAQGRLAQALAAEFDPAASLEDNLQARPVDHPDLERYGRAPIDARLILDAQQGQGALVSRER